MPSKSARQHRLMEAVAHNAAFAKTVGMAQKVGRDFVAADKAAGKFPAKEPKMAKKSPNESSAMAGGAGMSPRKAMASGKTGGAGFDVEPFHEMNGGMAHPDHAAHTGMKGAMEDGDRGAGPGVHHTKGRMPAQAAPDHGPHHPGGHGMHFNRDAKA